MPNAPHSPDSPHLVEDCFSPLLRAAAVGALGAAVLLLAGVGALAAEMPRFEQYAVAPSFHGRPAKVNLKSDPQARTFRTRLREGAAEGPNFAGHFTLVSWGCGTECQSIAVVDARNGAVRFAPFESELGQEFRLDSRLLVVNPTPEVERLLEAVGGCSDDFSWVGTRYYEWNGRDFVLLAETKACDKQPSAPTPASH